MSAVVTLWELLTKCQTITFIMNSSEELPWLPTEPWQTIIQNICPEFPGLDKYNHWEKVLANSDSVEADNKIGQASTRIAHMDRSRWSSTKRLW